MVAYERMFLSAQDILIKCFFDYVTYILSVRFAKDTKKGWVRICNHINPLLSLLIVDLLKKF